MVLYHITDQFAVWLLAAKQGFCNYMINKVFIHFKTLHALNLLL